MNQKMTQAVRDEKNKDSFRRSNFDRLNNYEPIMNEVATPQYVDTGRALITRLHRAIAEGRSGFRIPPGDYRFTDEEALRIDNVGDFLIEAAGAVFRFTPEVRVGLHFRNCRNVSLSGLTIDMDGLPFLQGTVESIDAGRKELTVKLDPSFVKRYRDRPPIHHFRVMFLDSAGEFETDNIDFRPALETIRFDGVDRIHIPVWESVAEHWKNQLLPPRPGDRVVFGMRQEGGSILVDGCSDMAFFDVTIHASQGFAFFESGHGGGGNRYRRCRLARRPGSGRLLAGAADCFHSLNQRRGPIVEECEFSWAMDDLVNIHGFFSVILETSGACEIILVAPHGVHYEAGSRLFFHTPPYGGKYAEAVVTDCEELPGADVDIAGPVQRFFRERYAIEIRNFPECVPCRIQLDRPVNANRFDLVSSSDFCCAGAVLRNNHLHDGHVRGILLKSPDSQILDNRIERIALSGIAVKPELFWLEGPFPNNLLIADNWLEDCAFDYTGFAAIMVASGFCLPPADRLTGEICMEHIVIRNNTIRKCNSGPGFLIANCRNPRVVMNKVREPFSNPRARKAISVHPRLDRSYLPVPEEYDYSADSSLVSAVLFIGCRAIDSRGNRFEDPDRFCRKIEACGPWCFDTAYNKHSRCNLKILNTAVP